MDYFYFIAFGGILSAILTAVSNIGTILGFGVIISETTDAAFYIYFSFLLFTKK